MVAESKNKLTEVSKVSQEIAITVVTVNYYSSRLLHDLFTYLLALADQQNSIRLLIADNTNGADKELHLLDFKNMTTINVDTKGATMSTAHGTGLNFVLSKVTSPYVLVIDPDVALLTSKWDRKLIEFVENEKSAYCTIGAPYPFWKLGKYHDYPSPVFAFWKTSLLRSLDGDWRPYAVTLPGRVNDFILRQFFWIPRFLDRFVIQLPARKKPISRLLEKMIGNVSKDTGWQIANNARKFGLKASMFNIVDDPKNLIDITDTRLNTLRKLASEFELYSWQGEIFITHRNPTWNQVDWSLWWKNNRSLRQNEIEKVGLTQRWQDLVAELRGHLPNSSED